MIQTVVCKHCLKIDVFSWFVISKFHHSSHCTSSFTSISKAFLTLAYSKLNWSFSPKLNLSKVFPSQQSITFSFLLLRPKVLESPWTHGMFILYHQFVRVLSKHIQNEIIFLPPSCFHHGLVTLCDLFQMVVSMPLALLHRAGWTWSPKHTFEF